MSVASFNPFTVLPDEAPSAAGQSGTRKGKNSKRADEPPVRLANKVPKASKDPLKDKSVGHAANAKVPVGKEAVSKTRSNFKAERTDRHSRKPRDTQKRINAGWGDDNKELSEELAGDEIARQDFAEEAEENAEASRAATQTLSEYLAAQAQAQLNLGVQRSAPKPNDGADENLWSNAKLITKPVQKKEEPVSKLTDAKKLESRLDIVPDYEDYVQPLKGERKFPHQSKPRGNEAPRNPRNPKDHRNPKDLKISKENKDKDGKLRSSRPPRHEGPADRDGFKDGPRRSGQGAAQSGKRGERGERPSRSVQGASSQAPKQRQEAQPVLNKINLSKLPTLPPTL